MNKNHTAIGLLIRIFIATINKWLEKERNLNIYSQTKNLAFYTRCKFILSAKAMKKNSNFKNWEKFILIILLCINNTFRIFQIYR